jgi:hypothetical protein
MKAKFKEGDKVWLPANKEEGWLDEVGTVIDVQKKKNEVIYGIQLDKKYITDKSDDGIRECGDVKPVSEFKQSKSNKSTNNLKTKAMAKSSKKSVKKTVTAKKTADRPAKKSVNADSLTRGQASEILKISIYAVDQLLVNKKLKGLSKEQVLSYKKTAKA